MKKEHEAFAYNQRFSSEKPARTAEWYIRRFQERLAILKPIKQLWGFEGLKELGIQVEKITSVVLQLSKDEAGQRVDILIDDQPNKIPSWGNHSQILECYHLSDDWNRHFNGVWIEDKSGNVYLVVKNLVELEKATGSAPFVASLKRYGINDCFNVNQDMYGQIKLREYNPERDIIHIS